MASPLTPQQWIRVLGASCLGVVAALGLAASATVSDTHAQWLLGVCLASALLVVAPHPALGRIALLASLTSAAFSAAAISAGWVAPGSLGPVAAAGIAACLTAILLSPSPRTRGVEAALCRHPEASGDGWLVTDRFGAVVAANDAAADALFGGATAGAQVVGRTLPKAMVPALGSADADIFRLALGGERVFEVSLAAAPRDGRGLRSATLREVTGLRHREQRLRRMVHKDSLTGLSNRRHFLQHLEARVAAHPGDASHQIAVVYIDLDSFKAINDELGHAAGDSCLRAMAKRFASIARGDEEGVPAEALGQARAFRLAGDEFAVIADGIASEDAAARLAKALVESGHQPIEHADQTFSTSLSVGISMCPEDGTDPEILMKHADAAMYAAKRCGKNCFEFYDASFKSGEERAKRIESGLRDALRARDLVLHYQPKIDAKTRTLVGFEALTRWTSEELGVVGPTEFIPVAERSGLVADLGAWCLREACRQLRVWSDQIRATRSYPSRSMSRASNSPRATCGRWRPRRSASSPSTRTISSWSSPRA